MLILLSLCRVTAWTAALPKLRANLMPAISEGTTEEDLLKAARDPAGPLFASGLCRIQVLRRRPIGKPWGMFFSSDDRGRRLSADLAVHELSVPLQPTTERGLVFVPA